MRITNTTTVHMTNKEGSVFLNSPQKKTLKNTRKKEKHATKIPSSRGRFIEDSSCFFVSGPRVKTKRRGEKERKEKIQKRLLW